MPRALLAVVAGLCATLHASARQANDPAPPAQQQAIDPKDLPAAVRLGARVEIVRRTIPVRAALVIVPTTAAYAGAIAAWSVEARFPVLLDDGTDAAQENIARFVRAFKPASVLRWSGPADPLVKGPAMRERIALAAARAWGAGDADSLRDRWKGLQFEPPGAVTMSIDDPAWTGGLALAAGRGQPILWSQSAAEPLGAILSEQQAKGLADFIASALDKTGFAWREPGDALESVTLCQNLGGRVNTAGGIVALTDLLGRTDKPPEANKPLPRAYIAGLVQGNEAQAAYAAMCALFLQPDSAWMINGYDAPGDDAKSKGFAAYNPMQAVKHLDKAGIRSTAEDTKDPLRALRARAREGINAGLIQFCTAGQRGVFMLKGAETAASEIPPLRIPAVVHFIHSFSAQDLSDKTSIAARFLENGAYAYVGSVDEPFLTAFQTPEAFAVRMLAPAPLGAAARVDSPRPWKINVYGDPLITFGPPAKRVEGEPSLPEPKATALEDDMKAALKDKRLLDAVRMLAMLGRDADAVRIYQAARARDPKDAGPDLSLAAFWCAARAGDADATADAFLWMPPDRAKEPRMIDAAWIALRPALDDGSRKAFDLLLLRMRPQTVIDDATLLAKAAQRLEGREAGREVILRAVGMVPEGPVKEKLKERLKLF